VTQVVCAVVILTYNCAEIIAETVAQALKVSPFVHVVDSYSKDDTVSIAERLGCKVMQRPFVNYSDQRNWSIDHVNGLCAWQLHLDADEVLDERAVNAIRRVIEADPQARDGRAYLLRRRDYFMGQELRFSGLSPWHLRLFPSGQGRCEDRLYDQHFLTELPVSRLPGLMHDKNRQSLSEWVTRHNRWSDLEAEQACRPTSADVLQPGLSADPRKRTRLFKAWYYKLPGGLRGVLYFLYRYLVRGGILDGRVGLYFALFQGLWFRTLVDAKIAERTEQSRETPPRARTSSTGTTP
jgi:glycosyltransferase involved in cell wall biosynthesis